MKRVGLTDFHLSAANRSASRVLRYAGDDADVRITDLGNRQHLSISADRHQEVLPMHRPIIKQPLNLQGGASLVNKVLSSGGKSARAPRATRVRAFLHSCEFSRGGGEVGVRAR